MAAFRPEASGYKLAARKALVKLGRRSCDLQSRDRKGAVIGVAAGNRILTGAAQRLP